MKLSRREHESSVKERERDEAEMTPGARRRIRLLEHRWRRVLKAMVFAGIIFVVAVGLTAWQITRAFETLEDERSARINASASVNTFLCRRIDSVGNGVAALVRVSLRGVDPALLTPSQRIGYNRFLGYAETQERPPRCRELALKIVTLTGSDPEDVKITPIRLSSDGR